MSTVVDRTARITGGLWMAINAANFLVWAAICVIGLHFEPPWWLASLAVTTAAVFGIRWYVGRAASR